MDGYFMPRYPVKTRRLTSCLCGWQIPNIDGLVRLKRLALFSNGLIRIPDIAALPEVKYI